MKYIDNNGLDRNNGTMLVRVVRTSCGSLVAETAEGSINLTYGPDLLESPTAVDSSVSRAHRDAPGSLVHLFLARVKRIDYEELVVDDIIEVGCVDKAVA